MVAAATSFGLSPAHGEVIRLAVAGGGGQTGGFQNGGELLVFNGSGFVIAAAGLPGSGDFHKIHNKTSCFGKTAPLSGGAVGFSDNQRSC